MENNYYNNGQNGMNPYVTEPVVGNRCYACQAQVDANDVFCPVCGAALKKRCIHCGADMGVNQNVCVNCGQPAGGIASSPVAKSSSKGWLVPVIVGGVLTLIIAIVIIVVVVMNQKPSFEEMFSEYKGEEWCEFSSDGSYMKIDTNPDNVDYYYLDDDMADDAWDAVEDINEKLGFSSSVYDDMRNTSYNDGKQIEENEDYKVTWTYHPNKGLEVKYEIKD